MNNKIIVIFLALPCLSSLLVAGCGIDSGPAAGLTKGQFIRKADAICSKATRQQFSAFGKAVRRRNDSNKSSPASKAQVEKLTVEVITPRARKMVDELSNLGAPPSYQGEFAALIGEFRIGIQRAEHAPTTFVSGKAFAKVDEAAEALGLTDCRI